MLSLLIIEDDTINMFIFEAVLLAKVEYKKQKKSPRM